MARAEDADMDVLGALWRRNEPSTETLGAEVRTRSLVAIGTVTLEVVLALAAGGVGVWSISLGTGYSLVVGAFALAFAAFALAVSWGAHRGEAWAADGLSVRDQLDVAMRQTLAIRRWARAGYGVSAGAVIFLGVTLLGPGRAGPVAWTFAVGGVGYIAAAVAFCAWLSARQGRRLARLRSLQRILFDEAETSD